MFLKVVHHFLTLAFVDRLLDDFRSHTSCVSEAERYEKTVYKGNKKSAKINPQEAWMDLIAEASESAPPALQSYMRRLSELDNVPRKEKPFRNWAANSLNLRGQQTLIAGNLWTFLSELREKDQLERKRTGEEEEVICQDLVETNQLVEKVPIENEIVESAPTQKVESITHFSPKTVRKTMKKILKKAPKRSMKIKALRSAVQGAIGISNLMRKKLKAMVSSEIQAYSKKIVVVGKVVTLK